MDSAIYSRKYAIAVQKLSIAIKEPIKLTLQKTRQIKFYNRRNENFQFPLITFR